jgi:hypothetical protein
MSIDCKAARALLLEAEPHELRGEGDSPLALHLVGCADCRGLADALLEGARELDAALAAIATPSTGARTVSLSARRRVAPGWLAGAGLAAAAALAALLLGRSPPTLNPGLQRERIAQALFPTPPVAAAPGHSVAVMKTSDPGVTVVWVY